MDRADQQATAAGEDPDRVSPWAEPIDVGAGETAVLICHGFTGSPYSVAPLAYDLAAAGFRVSVPRLPGHGTSWPRLNQTRWTDWYACVEQEFNRLRREHRRVVVAGLSMGGSLAVRLAERSGSDVAAVVLINPSVTTRDRRFVALPLLSRLVASIGGIASDIAKPGVDERGYPRTPLRALVSMTELWADVQAGLGRVTQPLLVFRSRVDHVVDPSSVELIRRRVASTTVTEVVLERSYHVATLDHDAPLISATTIAFLREVDAA